MEPRVIRNVLDSPAIGILHALETDGFQVELTADNVIRIAPKSQLRLACPRSPRTGPRSRR